MQDNNMTQLELFSQAKGLDFEPQRRGVSMIGFVRAYEKAVLLVIALVVTSVVSFSLGVEKGKRLALIRPDARFDTAKKNTKSGPLPAAQSGQETTEYASRVPAQTAGYGAYTIQLASFSTKSTAQKEMAALKKKGLTALTLVKGEYIVLCVGNFPTKESAQMLLTQLKKSYKGCYIRRI